MRDYINELDSSRFGLPIARIDGTDRFREAGFIPMLKQQGIRMIIARIPECKTDEINLLEELGFRIKDMQVTYRFDLGRQEMPAQDPNPDVVVRDAGVADIAALASIAELSFEGYGHYFADTRLDRAACREIYKDWATRSVIDRNVSDKVLVAEEEAVIAGFLSFKLLETKGTRYAAGGLGAVSEGYRGKDIFPTILRRGLLWGKEEGLDHEEHNVLVTNYPVNRSLSRLGFRQVRSFTTMHYWITD